MLGSIGLGIRIYDYEFHSRKYGSTEVRSRISKWETRNSASILTSDSEIRVKYEFPSPMERSIINKGKRWWSNESGLPLVDVCTRARALNNYKNACTTHL